jgi:50S ribosomal subunit-associated GTPase HflX
VLEAETEVRKARGKLKAAETDHAVAGRGVKTQERQKRTLQKQIEKFRKELAELKK